MHRPRADNPFCRRVSIRFWWLVAAMACAPAAVKLRPASPLEARYRLASLGSGSPATATTIYRDLLALTLFSRCRMVPSDSEAFDIRLNRCGPLLAAALASARLYLEVAGRPEFLRPLVMDGRLRWMDLPGDGCGP